jgi:hypothetical protein
MKIPTIDVYSDHKSTSSDVYHTSHDKHFHAQKSRSNEHHHNQYHRNFSYFSPVFNLSKGFLEEKKRWNRYV